MAYVNAGQVTPMLLRKSGTIERLSEGGLPVGLLPNSTYKQGEINLEEGNTLLCMSDGTEAANAQDELWAEEEVQNIPFPYGPENWPVHVFTQLDSRLVAMLSGCSAVHSRTRDSPRL